MKILNGNSYFEKADVLKIMDNLLCNLFKREFVKKQSSSDILHIQNAIKKFATNIILLLKTEKAVNFDYIETIYTEMMYPADNLLDPAIYNQMNYSDITVDDMRRCENWFFNYGIALIVSEFEK